MSGSGPAELVRHFYEVVISQNQADRIATFLSPDCTLRTGRDRQPLGVAGMQQHLAATKRTYPDYAIRITRQFCDGEYVISEFQMTGTHEGEWLGIRPSHRRLTFTGINIDRVVDGRIVEHGGAVNTFETLLSAGLIGPA